MGAAQSCVPCTSIGADDQTKLSRGIDKGLRETRRTLSNTPKILLLGSGDSGKSTIIKQMRLLNGVEFTEQERDVYRVQVFYNLVGGMRTLMEALREIPPLGEETGENGEERKDSKDARDAKAEGAILNETTNIAASPTSGPSTFGLAGVEANSTNRPTHHNSDSLSTPQNTGLSTQSHGRSPSGQTGAQPPTRSRSHTPLSNRSRSPSISLDMFKLGSLTPRQFSLLQELQYATDLRPGQSFPLEYYVMLLELWFGVQPPPSDDGHGGGMMSADMATLQAYGYGDFRGRDQFLRQTSQLQPPSSSKSPVRGPDDEPLNPLGQQIDRVEQLTGVPLPDNLDYLFSTPERLASYFKDDYMPSDADILRCRSRTTGIQETIFTLGKKGGLGLALREGRRGKRERAQSHGQSSRAQAGSASGRHSGHLTSDSEAPSGSEGHSRKGGMANLGMAIGKTRLHFVDVGGQRSERRKWIHCFQDVTAVLFLVGLSGYNQGLVEDPSANQMQDAMALWDNVCSSKWFRMTSLILFLNKTDLFASKVRKFPIRNSFPDYDGPDGDVRAGMDYFKRRFLRITAKCAARSAQAKAASGKNEKDRTRLRKDSFGGSNSHLGHDIRKKKSEDLKKRRSYNDVKGKGRYIPEHDEEILEITGVMGSKQGRGHAFASHSHGAAPAGKVDSTKPIGTTHTLTLGSSTTATEHSSSTSGSTTYPPSRVKDKEKGKNFPASKGVGRERDTARERTVYTHFTNATDTLQLKVVMLAVCDIILRDNFAHANLL